MNRTLIRFYAVGLLGVLVQLAALAVLTGRIGVHHTIATVIAVQIAVTHNFFWHERWTWGYRGLTSGRWQRYCRFSLSTGLISILTNVVVTGALIEQACLPVLAANSLAIGTASVANYLLSDLMVFRS